MHDCQEQQSASTEAGPVVLELGESSSGGMRYQGTVGVYGRTPLKLGHPLFPNEKGGET